MKKPIQALLFAVSVHALGGVAEARMPASEAPGSGTGLRPNFLWLDAEDANVNWFGCYGNPAATTPRIDRLAAEGFRYTHAFASAPVCSPSRSTWITGIHAVSTGTVPLRSNNAIPHGTIKYYPDYLRAAGYHATAPGKTDYNIGGRSDRDAWDAGRGWNDRRPGQPFFHVAHFGHSHENQAFGDVMNPRHDPARQRLRAYHPDIPDIRYNYAHYADAVQRLDTAVGRVLDRLEADGLADDTIVIFTTDHGGVLPGSKRFLTDSGIHAPFIIRIPEKFRHLWPAEGPGMAVGRLVGFVDMPKTWLSLAGAEVPGRMQGRVFLGPAAEPEAEMHFAFTSRQAERYYEMRAVRTKELLYIKNYKPYIPVGQPLSFLWQMVATRAWEAHHRAGLTDAATGKFFQRRQPVEELYDVRKDPDNVVNLADHPDYRLELGRLRSALRQWQLSVHDAGILSEEETARRAAAQQTTIYEMVRDPSLYPLESYLDAADLALAADPANTGRLVAFLRDGDSGIRYWGAIGLLMLDGLDPGAVRALAARLGDEAHDVRALAAWALFDAGHEKEAARACLRSLLESESYASLLVLNVIDLMGDDDLAYYLPAVRNVPNTHGNYEARMRDYFESGKSWDDFGSRIRPEVRQGIEAWKRRQEP